MRILNRYLFRSIIGATAMVLLVLLSVGGFVDFIGQLKDIEGDYTLPVAVQVALLKLPRLAAGMLPVSTLLGALLGLGALASHSELIVMRASGVSAFRLAASVGVAGLALAIVGGVVGEFIAPQMDLYARQMKAVAQNDSADMTGSSAWLRSGDAIVNVRPSIDGTDYGGVYVYRMGRPGRLEGIGQADSEQKFDGSWILSDYSESRLTDNGIELSNELKLDDVDELIDLLAITAVRESSLTGAELWAYIDYLQDNGLASERYEIAFWGRLATIVSIIVMCMLALPFVFGSLRAAGTGARMLIGVLFGLSYFLLSKTMADSGAVFDLSPLFVAWSPLLLLLTITIVLLRRVG